MPHARIAVPDRADAVLTVTDRSGRPIRRLDAGEQEAMLAAFARPDATHQDRERGAAVVREVQRHNRWLSCDCLKPAWRHPAAVGRAGDRPGPARHFGARVQGRKSWPQRSRPHGVLVFVAARIEDDALVAASGARLSWSPRRMGAPCPQP